jgi:hypothetical protein
MITVTVYKDENKVYALGRREDVVCNQVELVSYETISMQQQVFADRTKNISLGQVLSDGDSRGIKTLKIKNVLNDSLLWVGGTKEDFLLKCEQETKQIVDVPTEVAVPNSQVIIAGVTAVIRDGVGRVYINPASMLDPLEIKMPPSPSDGQVVDFFFGGLIAATNQVVDNLTIVPNTGQQMYQSVSPVQAYGGDTLRCQWDDASGFWRRIVL